ncbi:MAG TPA: PTS transporter subunit EIIC [Dongiaceae bacterium]|nr:PTS transporter subunit EIIC [Dongiaceae bacterium]
MSRSSGESRRSSASFRAPEPTSGIEPPAGDGLIARFERAVAPYAQRFAEAPATQALRVTLPLAFGVVVVYLVALLVREPFHGWAGVTGLIREHMADAFALASVVMVLALSFTLAKRLRYPALPLMATALIAFVLALPADALRALDAFGRTHGASGLGAFAATLGASGLFTAIVVCLVTAGAIGLARRRYGSAAGTAAGALGVLLVSGGLYVLGLSLAGVLSAALAPLGTLGDSFVALALITAIEAALWVVGIHGPALLAAIVLPAYYQLQFQNTDAHLHHAAIPHIVAVSTFMFVFPGGSGATLPLVVLMLRSRLPRLRTLAYASCVPAIFSINEPVIFGLPIAYNPVMAVPFVAAPVALACTTYAAMALGWVGRPVFFIPATLPAFMNAFLTTLDWRACVLVAVNLVVAGAIWLPFLRVYERAELARIARA